MDEMQHRVGELKSCCKSDVSVNGLIVHLQLPQMVPLLLRKEARGGGVAATSYCFASNEATKGLCDRPLETFAPCGGDS